AVALGRQTYRFQVRLRRGQVRPGAFHGSLVELVVDLVERLAHLYFFTFLEQALLDNPGDLRSNLRNPIRTGASGQFGKERVGLRFDSDVAGLQWARGGGLLLASLAAGRQSQ